MKKSFFVIALGIINLGYSLSKLFDSIVTESDEYGFSFNVNADYIIWLISGIIILIIGIMMSKEEKQL